MDLNEFERNFTCPICEELAQSAYQGQCCGVVLCEACLNRCRTLSPNCPKCRKEQYKTHPSIRIRMIVENSLIQCRQECGKKIKFKDRRTHEQFCSVTKEFFKNQINFYSFLRHFISAWSSLSYSLLKIKDASFQNRKKLQIIYENSILTIIQSFSKSQIQKSPELNDHRYWEVLIHSQKQYEQLILSLITILFRNKRHLETVKHCLVLIQLPLHHNNSFFVIQALTFSVKSVLLGKKGLEECYKELLSYFEKLNSENESQFYSYLVCLGLLIEIAHAMGKSEEEQLLLIKLSLAEDRARKVCFADFQTVCWYVNVLNHLKQTPLKPEGSKTKDEHEEEINQSIYLIEYHIKKIILTLKLIDDPTYIFTLFQSTTSIFSKEIYRVENPNLSAKFTEHLIINTIIEILSPSEKQSEPCFLDFMIQMGSEQQRLKIVYQLLCYQLCHKKFNIFNEPNQILRQKVISNIEDLIRLRLKNTWLVQENWQQISKRDFVNFIEQFKKLKLEKLKYDKLEIQLESLKQKMLHSLGQILVAIGLDNLNVKKQMLIRYLICKTFIDIFSSPMATKMIQYMEMAFYSVVFLDDKLLESKQLKQCVLMVSKAAKDNFIIRAFQTQFLNSSKNKIETQKSIKSSKANANLEIIKNPERDQIFKSENIETIMRNFITACEKVIVVSPRVIVKVKKTEEPEKKPSKSREPKQLKQPKNKK